MRNIDLSQKLFWVSCFAIVFGYGVAVGRFQWFPYEALRFGKDAVVDVLQERNTIARVRPDHFLVKAVHDGNGVTVNKGDSAAPGLTFIQGFFDGNNAMKLIRADGTEVHTWRASFSELVKDTSHIRIVPQSDWNVETHGALALPDGSVLFNFERRELVKLDRCGALQWTLHRMTHHSVERAEDGGFWVAGLRYRDASMGAPFPLLTTPFYEDLLLKVSPDGEVLTEISLPGLFFSNNLHGAILFANGLPGIELARIYPNKIGGEITHLNDIEELGTDMAAHFPQFAPGDLLISERDYNLLMVVDPKTQRVKWRQSGPWIAQHDPDFETSGRISVFSNNTDATERGTLLGGSAIVEVEPATGSVVSVYGGTPEQRWYTGIRGKHQSLPNGNVLITEAQAGRVFEVDRAGNVVWEFINRYDEENIALVFQAIRYPDDYFTVQDWTC